MNSSVLQSESSITSVKHLDSVWHKLAGTNAMNKILKAQGVDGSSTVDITDESVKGAAEHIRAINGNMLFYRLQLDAAMICLKVTKGFWRKEEGLERYLKRIDELKAKYPLLSAKVLADNNNRNHRLNTLTNSMNIKMGNDAIVYEKYTALKYDDPAKAEMIKLMLNHYDCFVEQFKHEVPTNNNQNSNTKGSDVMGGSYSVALHKMNTIMNLLIEYSKCTVPMPEEDKNNKNNNNRYVFVYTQPSIHPFKTPFHPSLQNTHPSILSKTPIHHFYFY